MLLLNDFDSVRGRVVADLGLILLLVACFIVKSGKISLLVLFTKDTPFIDLNVWLGKEHKVAGIVSEDLFFTVPKRKKSSVKAYVEYNGPLKAPIIKGEKIGALTVYIDGEIKKEIDILSNENVKRANIFSRLFRSLNYLVWGDV